ARARHLQPGAHLHDRMTGLLRVDELVLGERHRVSDAKKAAAFFKKINFSRSSAFSRSSSRIRARSGPETGGCSCCARAIRCRFTQLPRVLALMSNSRATDATVRSPSSTMRMASSLNSGENCRRRLATYLPLPDFCQLM